MAVPSAAAVGAFLALLQHVPRGDNRISPEPSAASLQHSQCDDTCSSESSAFMAIQLRHITCAQQVLAAHKQPSLLAALSPLLPSQQPYSQQQQHLLHVQSWQQLWPSQRRGFCSSSASQSKPVWPNAVPSLHQPQKHSAGQLVRKPPEQFTPGAAAAAADSSAVKPAEALAAKAENIWGRVRITLIRGVLCITIPATIVVVYRHILLGSSADYLRTANPLAHKTALKHLRWWLRWRETFGEALVQQMVSYGTFQPLVGLVQPGTDALVLIEACEMMKGLLDSPTAVTAMSQAGLQKAVDAGLRQGWVPTGALYSMTTLQKALKS